MPDIPNSEPERITAGETVRWRKSLAEFPAGPWKLKYTLQAAGKVVITVATVADGTVHAVEADSSHWAPGVYLLTGFVEAEGKRHVVHRGTVSILPDPRWPIGSTHASRTLELIEAALEGRIPNGLESTNIDGQALNRIPITELHRLRDKYRREVKAEADALRAEAGQKIRRTVGIRFVAP